MSSVLSVSSYGKSLVLLVELRVEDDRARGEIDLAHEGAGFRRAVHAVHAAVFPLDAERAAVADVVQGDDDVLELDVAVAEGAEIPVAPRVAEGHVTAEDTNCAVAVAPPDVLHVDVIDAVAERAD